MVRPLICKGVWVHDSIGLDVRLFINLIETINNQTTGCFNFLNLAEFISQKKCIITTTKNRKPYVVAYGL